MKLAQWCIPIAFVGTPVRAVKTVLAKPGKHQTLSGDCARALVCVSFGQNVNNESTNGRYSLYYASFDFNFRNPFLFCKPVSITISVVNRCVPQDADFRLEQNKNKSP